MGAASCPCACPIPPNPPACQPCHCCRGQPRPCPLAGVSPGRTRLCRTQNWRAAARRSPDSGPTGWWPSVPSLQPQVPPRTGRYSSAAAGGECGGQERGRASPPSVAQMCGSAAAKSCAGGGVNGPKLALISRHALWGTGMHRGKAVGCKQAGAGTSTW
jgi:hypothetical protein